jgi:predicted flavoprotein YhiN
MTKRIVPTYVAEQRKKCGIGELYITVLALSGVLVFKSGYYESEWEHNHNSDIFIDNVPTVNVMIRKATYDELANMLYALKKDESLDDVIRQMKKERSASC